MNQPRFWSLLLFLILASVLVNGWERVGEARVSRKPLEFLPSSIGTWQQVGGDTRFDPETEAVLRADDYVERDYELPDGRVGSIYVGYYATQRSGATYHSPLNCLPGSGWEMSDPASVTIHPAGGGLPSFVANSYVVSKDNFRELMIYWYQGRGRAVASEYWSKVYTVVDSVRRRRSDGAMVRVMVPMQKSETEAENAAADLAAQLSPVLPDYVPN